MSPQSPPRAPEVRRQLPKSALAAATGLLIALLAMPEAAAQGECPSLVEVIPLTTSGVFEDWPAAAFADAGGTGLIVWSKSFNAGCSEYQEMFFSEWNGTSWTAAASIPSQPANTRHKRHTMSFRPGTTEAVLAYNTSVAGGPCFDEIGSRAWTGSTWDAGVTAIGDLTDDDDTTGNLRFAADGSYGLVVWGDGPMVGSSELKLSCNVWDPIGASWGPQTLIQNNTGLLPSNHQRDNRSLVYDSLDDAWILVYQKRESTVGFDPTKNEIAYQRGTGSVAGVTFAGEVLLTTDSIEDDRPIVAVRPNGEIACFFTSYIGGNGEICVALWDDATNSFLAPVVLTSTALDEFVEVAVGTAEGWEIVYLSTPQGEVDTEIYYARFDGVEITDSFRLTRDTFEQRHTDAAVDSDGNTHLVWTAGDDIYTAYIDFGPERVPSFCDGYDGSHASCPCANAGDPGSGCDIVQGTGGVSLCLVSQLTTPDNRATVQGTGFPKTASPTSIVIRATGLDGTSPVVFGDGLRCIGTPLVRLAATFASGGVATHTFGHGSSAGAGKFYYQLWFRNTPVMFCTPAAFNLSNGRILDW